MVNVPMQFVSRDKCPICSSTKLRDHLNLDGLRIAVCGDCDFMFTRDILTQEALLKNYVEGYEDQRHFDGQRVNATVNRELLLAFEPTLDGKTILDIGSGFGLLLAEIKKVSSARVAGVEISKAERAYATDKLGIQTFSSLSEIPADATFDIVTLFEVIEHITDPIQFLTAAVEHLKPGGSLIIGTDNFASDVVRTLGAGFPKWIPNEHVSLFTPATLKMALERIDGVRIVGSRSFTPWELVVRKLVYLITSGKKGGVRFDLQDAVTPSTKSKPYKLFALRFALNKLWFNVTNGEKLNGELMYFHAVKAKK